MIVLTSILWLGGCKNDNQPLDTVDNVDLEQYKGTWYEIARLPNTFEDGLNCVTANYELLENGKIRVINRGHRIGNPDKVKEAKGIAWVPDSQYPGRLKVRFFWPFAGDYYIIVLSDDYKYALVGDPSREYLWILSRTPSLDNETMQYLINQASDRGFDTGSLMMVEQGCG